VTTPLSPYRKRNAITPTNGGSAAGSVATACRKRRPRNSTRLNTNASGSPTAVAATTEPIATSSVVHSASRSLGLFANSRQ
jgi:hypothetical protein